MPSSKPFYSIYAPSQTSLPHQPLPADVAQVLIHEWDSRDWNQSSDAFADWLNARWAKTGYQEPIVRENRFR
ncbi:hypothetical protein PRZ48_008468 [Zasmidium cellare]|uniref:Uncharacterized protein n=1 Tax=Zasmidium cellare TaxID=395010 RepID=A0ABR0EFX6_ZASCE|nr:hypothetical protein PRZ48_008468 [Zasmidium cellare]